MKNFYNFSIKTVLILLLGMALLSACKGEKPAPDALDKDTSYAFGMFIASQMGLADVHFDYDAFKEGFRDFNEAAETRLTWEQMAEKISVAVNKMQGQRDEEMWLEGEKNREAGEAFLAENRARSGVITTPSGLQYEVISQGSGEKPDAADKVRVHYEGTLIDGTVFDSSYNSGEPIEFNLDMVIPGWTEGVQLMNEGSTYRFVIPSDLAYGSGGTGPIPPNSTLIFQVELLSIIK
jgi:FKBP-type peptidyl-prolyl cis-trans isomerase